MGNYRKNKWIIITGAITTQTSNVSKTDLSVSFNLFGCYLFALLCASIHSVQNIFCREKYKNLKKAKLK